MAEHRSLTGASLHEPKGVETASSGQVYVANGSGSGTWTDRLSGINNLNSFNLSGRITDISTAGSDFYTVAPTSCSLNKIYVILSGSITTTDDTLTIYKNGIAQTPTVTVPFTGSGAGVQTVVAITPNISFAEGDVIRVASSGASDTVVAADVLLRFTAG